MAIEEGNSPVIQNRGRWFNSWRNLLPGTSSLHQEIERLRRERDYFEEQYDQAQCEIARLSVAVKKKQAHQRMQYFKELLSG